MLLLRTSFLSLLRLLYNLMLYKEDNLSKIPMYHHTIHFH